MIYFILNVQCFHYTISKNRFIYLFSILLKSTHFIRGYILSFPNFENIKVIYSNTVSPPFSYFLSFFINSVWKLGIFSVFSVVLKSSFMLCTSIFLHVCWLSSPYSLQFTIFSSPGWRFAQTFFEKCFISSEVYFISWFLIFFILIG